MSYLPTQTRLEKNTALTAADAVTLGEAIHHTVTIQREIFRRFWGRPAEEILEEVNSDPARYASMLGANTAIGVPNNAQLDALTHNDPVLAQRFPNRAPVAMPVGWSFAPESGFAYAAAPENNP
jgi:hypothetical protein